MTANEKEVVENQQLKDRELSLVETKTNLEESLQFVKLTQKSSADSLAKLEEDHRLLQKELNKSVQSGSIHAAKVEQLQLNLSDVKLQLGKAKDDIQSLSERNNLLSIENCRLLTKFEEAVDSNFNLQNQHSLILQELDVVQVERDELVRRFIGEGFTPSSPRRKGQH